MRLKPHVGLLITPTAIEAAQCSQTAEGIVDFDFYHHATLATPVVDEEGEILDATALSEALRAFWAHNGIKERNVVLGLSGSRAIARMVSLPRIPANQVEQAVLSEAEQYTQFRDAEPMVDHFTVEADEDATTVFYAASTQPLIDAYVQALKAAKLNLKAVDLVQFASLRNLANERPSREAGWDGVVVLPGRLVITAWSTKELQTWREVTLPAADEGQLNQFIETEVSRTVRADAADHGELLVAGATLADSARLATYFSAHTDLPLRAIGLDRWTHRVPAEVFGTLSPAVLGLALWGAETGIPSLDVSHRAGQTRDLLGPLLAALERLLADRTRVAAVVSVLAGLGVTLAGTWWFGSFHLGGQNRLLQAEIDSLAATNAGLTARVLGLEKETGINDLVLKVIGEASRPNLTIAFLDELAELMPPDAFVEQLQAETPDQMLLMGRSASQGAGLQLARTISGYREVGAVEVVDLLRSDDGTYNYRMRIRLLDLPPLAVPAATAAVPAALPEGVPQR
ncbi:MAG: pilus assembly protein PilM [Candidatus Sericytochromatia bacterium]|nr:pilus assembly protein PilM [Candidatus Sericytochromatia bacterium]